MTKTDVVLIGSGISSLTAAAILAKKGRRVVVLEQHVKPGGYMHCFQRFGERFDTGAHYVGAMDPGQPFHTLLRYLDVFQDDLFVPLDPTGFDVFHFPEFTVRLPKGYGSAVESLSRDFPNEKPAIREFFDRVRTAARFFPTYEFDDARFEVPSAGIFETSLETVVRGLIKNPRLQSVLYAYCSLHGVEPGDVPFGFHSIVVDSLIRGPYGLKNGGDALAAAFVRVIEKNGGQVLTKRRVRSLRVHQRHVTAVETDGGELFQGEWVVSGLHPKLTFALCSDQSDLSQAFTERLKNLRESTGLFGVSLTSTADLSPLRNYYFFNHSEPELLLKTGSATDLPSAVFMAPSSRDFSAARPLPLNLHSAGPIEWFSEFRTTTHGRRDGAYRELKAGIAENTFRLVERYYPGFRQTVKQFTASTPLTNLHFNGSPDGTAYGLYHSVQNTGPRAIGPRTKILNLLLAGQNCLFPGLLGAAVSGLRTAGHMVGIKPILAELKELGKQE